MNLQDNSKISQAVAWGAAVEFRSRAVQVASHGEQMAWKGPGEEEMGVEVGVDGAATG